MPKLISPIQYAHNLRMRLDMTKRSNITGFRDLLLFLVYLNANGYFVSDNSSGKFTNFSIYKHGRWLGKIKIVNPGTKSKELDTKLKIIVGCKDGPRDYVISSFKTQIETIYRTSLIKIATKQMMIVDNITHGLSILATIY